MLIAGRKRGVSSGNAVAQATLKLLNAFAPNQSPGPLTSHFRAGKIFWRFGEEPHSGLNFPTLEN
jgi:hypothetical protein